VERLDALKGGKLAARRRQLRSSWLSSARGAGGKLPPAKQTSWNRSMDEKQDTAVRHLKKQNRMKQAKFRGKRLQVCTTYYGGQRSQADSVANLPDGSDKFSLRNPKFFPFAAKKALPQQIVLCRNAFFYFSNSEKAD